MPTSKRSSAGAILATWLRRIRDRIRGLTVEAGTVCYFPRFRESQELANHYYRAAWYLPHRSGHCQRVRFFVDAPLEENAMPDAPPPYMAAPKIPGGHLEIGSGLANLLKTIVSADLILVWRTGRWTRWVLRLRALGFRVVVVDTNATAAREYVQYANLLWYELTPEDEREAVIARERERFHQVAARLRNEVSDRAYVFGTGPTLNRSIEHGYDGALRIACNTIVASPTLLDHIAPHFIAAADVVSHFGISRYAARFRESVIECLGRKDGPMFVTTTALGTLLTAHHPELREHVLLIEYGGHTPCLDLTQDFRAPALESVFNSFMLPLATTFCRHVCLVGCDGKASTGENEDFWPHAAQAHFADLVDTGHLCHPTFDANRQHGGYERYDSDVRRSIEAGQQAGVTYTCLYPSNLPALAGLAASPSSPGSRTSSS